MVLLIVQIEGIEGTAKPLGFLALLCLLCLYAYNMQYHNGIYALINKGRPTAKQSCTINTRRVRTTVSPSAALLVAPRFDCEERSGDRRAGAPPSAGSVCASGICRGSVFHPRSSVASPVAPPRAPIVAAISVESHHQIICGAICIYMLRAAAKPAKPRKRSPGRPTGPGPGCAELALGFGALRKSLPSTCLRAARRCP